MNKTKTFLGKVAITSLVGAMVVFGFAVNSVSAHEDPGGCSASGVGLSLTAFRSDGITPIGGNLVAPGETIVYKAQLSHLNGTNCNFEGGTLSITTPDGAVNVVASPATPVVPLVTTGSPFTSVGVNYVVSYAHSGGDGILDATSTYSGGTSHTPTVHSTVGANNGISVVMEGRIIVDKVSNPSSEQDFEFDPSWTTNFFLDDTDTPNDSGPLVLGVYDVAEVNLPAGWTLTSTNCVSSIQDPEDTDGQALDLGAGEIITCTFTNTQGGHIIVDKVTDPTGDSTEFDFNPSWSESNFTLTDQGAPVDSGDLTPGNYSVAELAETGWTSDDGVCDSSDPNDTSTPGNIDLGPGETVTCTFTNTLDQGKIELQKDFVGTAENVTLEIGTTEGGSETDSQALSGDGSTGENEVAPGTYYVSETLTTPANYTSVLACYNDLNDDDAVDGGDTAHPFVEATGAVVVGNGDDVLCVFTNTFNPGNIIVVKQTDPDGDQTEFEFDSSYGDNFMLSDGDQNDSGELAPGSYTVSELAEDGWTQTSAVCDSTDEADTSTPGNIDLDAGETVTCTFTNTKDAEPGKIIVIKQTDPNGDPQSFEFDTDYGDNFNLTDGQQNDSGELDAGTYSVAEVNLPDNWALSNATCDDGSSVDSIELGEGETVTCTFTNTFTPPATQGCSPGYWKQSQHFGSYPDGVYPNDLFTSVGFEDAFPGKSLLQVLNQGGGGLNALGRIIVAAYLNAATVEDFPYTAQEVVDDFNAVFPGGDYNALKAKYEALQDPCPHGNNPGPAGAPRE